MEIKERLRLNLADVRLAADPLHQAQLRLLGERIVNDSMSPALTLQEFDEKYADELTAGLP